MDPSQLPAGIGQHWQAILSWIFLVAAVITAVGVVYAKFFKPVVIKNFVKYLITPIKNHVAEVRENNLAVRDMVTVVGEVKDIIPKLKQVCKMVMPNHGSSLPDGLSRVEAQLLQLVHQMSQSEAIQEALLLDHPKAVFISDMENRNTFVNKKYAELIRCDREELLELGWRTYLMPSELLVYDTIWKSAFRESRDSFFTLKMRTKRGMDAVTFSVKVSVLRSSNGKPTGQFMGIMDEVAAA